MISTTPKKYPLSNLLLRHLQKGAFYGKAKKEKKFTIKMIDN